MPEPIINQTSTTDVEQNVENSTIDSQVQPDLKKLDDDLFARIATLIDEKLKTVSSPKLEDKKVDKNTDINSLIQQQVQSQISKLEYDMFINNLKPEDFEVIKSIPDYNKLSTQQLKAIIGRNNSLPKLSPKIDDTKSESVSEYVNKLRGKK